MAETTLRDTFNAADENRVSAAFADLQLGEVLTILINALTATEAAVVPASDIATLAATPQALLNVNVTAGTVTGVKKILKGRTDPDGIIRPIPATGEVTWNGATKLRFAAADGATAISAWYTTSATSTPGYLRRALGQINT